MEKYIEILEKEKASEPSNIYPYIGKSFNKNNSLQGLIGKGENLEGILNYCINEDWTELNALGIQKRVENMYECLRKIEDNQIDKEETSKKIQEKIILTIYNSLIDLDNHPGVKKDFFSSRVLQIYQLIRQLREKNIDISYMEKFELKYNMSIFCHNLKFMRLREEEKQEILDAIKTITGYEESRKEFIGEGTENSVWKISKDLIIKIGTMKKTPQMRRILTSIKSGNNYSIQPMANTKTDISEDEIYECWAEILDNGYILTDIAERNFGRTLQENRLNCSEENKMEFIAGEFGDSLDANEVVLLDRGYLFQKGEKLKVPEISLYYRFIDRYKKEIQSNQRKSKWNLDDLKNIRIYHPEEQEWDFL